MTKKRGLNSGLSELLSDLNITTIGSLASGEAKTSLRQLPVDLLQPGKYQPRRSMSQTALVELAESIRKQGIIQPVIVRAISVNSYEIIAGERRWRAAQLANLHEVPAVVREISDQQAIAMALVENLQREDLNAIETATSLQKLITEFKITHEGAADIVGKSRAAVTNLLRLLELPENIKAFIVQGQLEMGHARALLPLSPAKQLTVAQLIIAKGLSVRAAESLVRQLQQERPLTTRSVDANTVKLQQQLAEKLAALVNIQHSKSGKGKIVIAYDSLDELEGILEHFV